MDHESTIFYQEDLGVSEYAASNIAKFMDVAMDCRSVTDPNIWKSDDETVVRVYFSVWSQNRFPATRFLERAYYCPEDDEVYFDDILDKGIPLTKVSKLRKEFYSGAKTRKAIEEFAERFYAENI